LGQVKPGKFFEEFYFMSSLKIQGNASGAGITTLQSANTGTSATFTLPATDGTANQVLKTDGSGNLGFATAGDVVGPASATDNALAVFDTGTGKLLKNSTITASGAVNSVGFIGAPQQSGGASAYTAVLADQGKHIIFTGGSTATLTIPTNATVAFPTGTAILVVNDNSGNLTISGAGVVFQLANGATGNRTVATKGLATCLKTGTDTWYVSGAGVT
jgi:hypothetical protein